MEHKLVCLDENYVKNCLNHYEKTMTIATCPLQLKSVQYN